MPRVLVKRAGAFGDVIETTPIIERLKREDPDTEIFVETHYARVFDGNPHVTYAGQRPPFGFDRIIDLDMAFERRLRKMPAIDAYSEEAFGDRATPRRLTYYGLPRGMQRKPNNIVIHPCRNWPIRTLPLAFWQDVVSTLRTYSKNVVVTGTQQDWPDTGGFDLRDLSLPEQVALIGSADCFLCSESGPMILAQVTDVPIVALTTMVPPEHVLHERRGELGWGMKVIHADVPCFGCEYEQNTMVTYFDCMHGHRRCVTSFDVNRVVGTVLEMSRQE